MNPLNQAAHWAALHASLLEGRFPHSVGEMSRSDKGGRPRCGGKIFDFDGGNTLTPQGVPDYWLLTTSYSGDHMGSSLGARPCEALLRLCPSLTLYTFICKGQHL